MHDPTRAFVGESGGRRSSKTSMPRFLFGFYFGFNYSTPHQSHCRKQHRKRKADEMETLNKNLPSKSEDLLETGIA